MILINNCKTFKTALDDIKSSASRYDYRTDNYKLCEKYISGIYLEKHKDFDLDVTSNHMKYVWNGRWGWRHIYSQVLAEGISPSLGDKILLSQWLDPSAGEFLLEDGVFSSKNIINKIALSDSPMAEKCASLCDIKTLKKLKRHSNKKIRNIVYERLGPVECMDDMLSDKDRNIRIAAAKYAPKNYSFFNNMVSDRSDAVFRLVCKKVKHELLPIMLGSNHVDNPKLSRWWSQNKEARIIIMNRMKSKK